MTDELMDSAAAGEVMATAPPRGRAVRALRRGVARAPGPARRRVPRLRGRRRAARPATGRRRGTDRRSSAARSPASSPRRCTCRSASAITSTTSCFARVGMAMLGEGRAWVMPGPDWAGTVTFYEDFPYAAWNGFTRLDDLRRRRPRRDPRGRLAVARVRRHLRPGRTQDHRHRALREPDRPPLRRCQADGERRAPPRPPDRRARRARGRVRGALLDLRPGLIPVARRVDTSLGARIVGGGEHR